MKLVFVGTYHPIASGAKGKYETKFGYSEAEPFTVECSGITCRCDGITIAKNGKDWRVFYFVEWQGSFTVEG